MVKLITTQVHSIDELFEALDGKKYMLDGIAGKLRLEYFRDSTRLHHHPSAKGKATEAYQEIRKSLGDDWTTELTNSDRLGEIAISLGIEYC